MTRIAVSFVCTGNICRSPTAEAVMRHLVQQAGLAGVIEIDSAGTGSWHVGEVINVNYFCRSAPVIFAGRDQGDERVGDCGVPGVVV